MDYEHKSRSRWRHLAPDALSTYLAEAANEFHALGGQVLHVPRQVEVKEVNQKDRGKVRGRWLERTWPNHIGFMPDGRALALETLKTSHAEHLRCSLVPSQVLAWLADAARAGGVAAVFVRSCEPRDFLIPVNELGLLAGRGREELWWWEELEPFRVKPGQAWWEVLA